jgi:alkylation response protein AidB-like acyl-CoA dehydrogenase
MLLLTRTTPIEQVKKKTDGMTLFFADIDRSAVEVRELHKCGRSAVDTNMLFIDNLYVALEDRVGEEGKGFSYILDGINPERILIAAEAIGMGKRALDRAVRYAKERVVFHRPIGMNQGIQFPLADSAAKLETAELMVYKAAWLYDRGRPCGKKRTSPVHVRRRASRPPTAPCRRTAARLHQGLRRRALLARVSPLPHRADLAGDGAQLCRRARAGAAAIVLRGAARLVVLNYGGEHVPGCRGRADRLVEV